MSIWLKSASFMALLGGMSLAMASTSYAQTEMSSTYSGPEISYAQIYDNPDDYQLNFDYARQEAQAGNLLNAASTLERLLFVQPGWHSARLYYAAILYRLDDVQAAMRELDLLDGQDLNAQQKSLKSKYRNIFSGNASSSHSSSGSIAGRVALGYSFDSNAGNAFADNSIYFSKQDDQSWTLRGQITGETAQSDAGLSFIGGLFGMMRRYNDFDIIDHEVIGGHVGLKLEREVHNLRANVLAQNVRIDGNDYFSRTGLGLNYAFDLDDMTSLFAGFTYWDEDFENLSLFIFDSLRSGDRKIFSAGIAKAFSAQTQGKVAFELVSKDASIALYRYDGWTLGLNGQHNFDNETYLTGRFKYSDFEYDTLNQEEQRISAEIAYGVPLSNFGMNNDLAGEVAITRTERNFTNFLANDYDNTGVELRLVWDF